MAEILRSTEKQMGGKKWENRKLAGHTDRQTERQPDITTGKQKDRCKEIQTDFNTNKKTEAQTDRNKWFVSKNNLKKKVISVFELKV